VLVRLLVRWACNVVALYAAAALLDGVTFGGEWGTLIAAAAVFTLVNAWLRPLVKLLSLPFIVLTLGLFLLVVNALMLYVTDWLVADFDIRSFGAGVLAAIIVSLVNWALHALVPGRR
jgi:putative membrane protein